MTALNISPITPIRNLNNNPLPINNNHGSSIKVTPKKGAFDNIDIDEIGQGRLMTEGSYDSRFGKNKYMGLKGQLMKAKHEGRHSTTKNLSMSNIKQIHDVIAKHLKKQAVNSKTYISRGDRLAIMKESRAMVRSKDSNFTSQDRQDLIKIVDSLQKQYKDKILHRRDDIHSPRLERLTSASIDRQDSNLLNKNL
ncbi:MAG: hypothetical protein PHE20_03800 [Patescibacteria group bacterium]|nr:hypothetical protein [Patescibacteria group bacterium]